MTQASCVVPVASSNYSLHSVGEAQGAKKDNIAFPEKNACRLGCTCIDYRPAESLADVNVMGTSGFSVKSCEGRGVTGNVGGGNGTRGWRA